uniref:dihydropteroate synthase n=1 Tax=uncultured marine thaumarchaeote KM3_78_E10 TaxID=1456292 RepID=A0A075HMN4_9ARCH|nr:dihydropteroate synthase (folP) [uncultured marine thaumarchaeote KM3_78_E10]
MGILNTSPESFYKKSISIGKQKIIDAIHRMEEEGANFIDIGGMSTAPYLSTMVSERIEATRIINAVKIVQRTTNLPISVDTCRATVAKDALEFGVDIINDVTGLKYDPTMPKVIEKYNPSLILCAYSKKIIAGNQISETKQLLKKSLEIAKSAGVPRTKIVLDPAIGFFRKKGRNPFFTKINSSWVQRDLLILKNLREIKLNMPLFVSVSNKSFIGQILKKDNLSDRLAGSLTAEVVCVLNGADIIRTHNVAETRKAVTIAKSLS